MNEILLYITALLQGIAIGLLIVKGISMYLNWKYEKKRKLSRPDDSWQKTIVESWTKILNFFDPSIDANDMKLKEEDKKDD